MTSPRKPPEPERPEIERGAGPGNEDEHSKDKLRVPSDVRQEPGETPIGNGGTNGPAAFPPHH